MKANLHFIEQIPKNRMGAFQFVADWRGRQQRRRAVGSATAHNQFGRAKN